jgi:hypothetical protein
MEGLRTRVTGLQNNIRGRPTQRLVGYTNRSSFVIQSFERKKANHRIECGLSEKGKGGMNQWVEILDRHCECATWTMYGWLDCQLDDVDVHVVTSTVVLQYFGT